LVGTATRNKLIPLGNSVFGMKKFLFSGNPLKRYTPRQGNG
jgi:hypothetical protein